MSKVTRINLKTPANILADALEKAVHFDSVIVIGLDKEDNISVGWSDQSSAVLAYSSVRFQSFIQDYLDI